MILHWTISDTCNPNPNPNVTFELVIIDKTMTKEKWVPQYLPVGNGESYLTPSTRNLSS